MQSNHKKSWFLAELDTTLKQHYASQLHNHSSVSIAKTLLMQMPQMSFTQFCNELSQALGTHQCAGTKASVKTVSASAVETKSVEKGAVVKSKHKQDNKISAQSSQIKDLCTKLDQAVAENSQNQGISEPNIFAKGIYKCLASC